MKKYDVDTKVVKSRRIAWLLRKEGYQILKTAPDRFRPEYDIYIFKNENGLSEALTRHIHEQEKYREMKEKS